MPLHGLQHQSRPHSNTHTPETPGAGSALIQAAQTLTGIGQPNAASSAISQQQQQPQQHLQQPGGTSSGGLRVQTSQSNLTSNSGPGSGVTPIYSGSTASGGALSSASTTGLSFSNRDPPSSSLDQQKKPTNLAFQLPSPTKGGNQGDLYGSPQELHYPHHPSDSIPAQQLSSSGPSSQHQPQQQQYQAYSSQPPSNTGSRPQLHTTTTAPGSVPRISDPLQQQQPTMHRTSTNTSLSHSSKYSPQLNTSSSSVSNRDNSAVSAGGDPGRKYTHPGALTPTYPSSSQHSSSHSHSSAAHLGMGLSGLTSPATSTREREETAVGAVGNGKWMSPWSLYALDWCKWQPTNGGYGRVAIGSYAEDSHNYVSLASFLLASKILLDRGGRSS